MYYRGACGSEQRICVNADCRNCSQIHLEFDVTFVWTPADIVMVAITISDGFFLFCFRLPVLHLYVPAALSIIENDIAVDLPAGNVKTSDRQRLASFYNNPSRRLREI